MKAKVTFHDSCYPAAANQVYESPARCSRPGGRWSSSRSSTGTSSRGLYSGAGGAQYFMEETGGA
ncbi:MAG: hypothetical protein R3B99_13200 [Polyangiales bacterium]